MHISSRPEEELDLTLASFNYEELQLICAFLYQTRLGVNGVYKQAAYSMLTKIEDFFLDEDFPEKASEAVKLKVRAIDRNGTVIAILDDFEFDV